MGRERFEAYRKKLEERKRLAEHLERMSGWLYKLDDNQLRIACKPHGYTENQANKWPCQGYYPNPGVPASYLAEVHQELATDPAFQRLCRAEQTEGLDHWNREEINRLATRMANRQTTQDEYEQILRGGYNCMVAAESIMGDQGILKQRMYENIFSDKQPIDIQSPKQRE